MQTVAAAPLLTAPTTAAAPTRSCYDTSCNWARSHVSKCECACGGRGHGGAYRVTAVCAHGEAADECWCSF